MASLRRRPTEDERARLRMESSELVDVPAAVVCAVCGDADCQCESELSRSGVVAIIAWERPGPALPGLWATARATTRDVDSFFELLPDGPVLPALRFAALTEIGAIGTLLLCVIPIAAVVAPQWLTHLVLDPAARSVALRVAFLGVPAFAALLVLGHAAHGLSIDIGATRNGARSARSRALRFGLYACGWDLVNGPLGAIVIAVKEGVRVAFESVGLGSGLPTRATKAFLRGAYRLDGERAKRALNTSFVGAAIATLVGAFFILGALIALALV